MKCYLHISQFLKKLNYTWDSLVIAILIMFILTQTLSILWTCIKMHDSCIMKPINIRETCIVGFYSMYPFLEPQMFHFSFFITSHRLISKLFKHIINFSITSWSLFDFIFFKCNPNSFTIIPLKLLWQLFQLPPKSLQQHNYYYS